MIIIVQIIVIIVALVVAIVGLGNRSSYSGKAWKKIALMLLVIAMVVAVLFPNTTNNIAHLVGIGRGADLLLYGTVLAFIFYALNNYLQQQDARDTLFRLARKVSLLEANERYGIYKKRK